MCNCMCACMWVVICGSVYSLGCLYVTVRDNVFMWTVCVCVCRCVCWRAMKPLLSLVDQQKGWARPLLPNRLWVWSGQAEEGTPWASTMPAGQRVYPSCNQLQTQQHSCPLMGGCWKHILASARSPWGEKKRGRKKIPERQIFIEIFRDTHTN